MLNSAERVLESRRDIKEKAEKLIDSTPTAIDFRVVKKMLLDGKEFTSNPDIRFELQGFDDLEPLIVNQDLFMNGIINESNGRYAIKAMTGTRGHNTG